MNARPVLWAGAADAAAAVRQLCPQAAADALARAGEICGHTFLFRDHWEMEPTREPVHFDGPVVWDAVPAGDPEWTYALNRHTIFLHLGRAWQYTGQARYLDAFVSLLGDWLDRVPRTPASENTTWRALEAGLRPENWLRALGLFGPAVPEALGRRIDESLAAHGDYLARAHGPFQRLSNWGAIQAHGLFLIGLWLGRADWQALALGRLAENLRHAVLPDGVQWEQSPMYHCEVLHALLDTLLLAERNGIDVPPLLPEKARAMCRALAVWAAPDRTILPQGDSDVIDAGDLLAAGALLFRDPLLAAAAQGPLCEETLWDFGPDAPARLAALPAAWPACPSQKLEASGNYILRSGWGREDTWIHFRAGSLGGGHGHADLLHVDVYHGGEAVLTDAGRGTYVDGGLRRALKGPAALCPAGGPSRRGAPGVSGPGRGGGAAAGLSQAGAAGGGGHPPRPGRTAPPGRAVLPLRPGPADGRGERRPLGGRAHLRPAPLAQRAAGRMFRRALRPRLQPGGRCPGPPAGCPGCGRRDGPGVGAQSGRPLPGRACAGVHRGGPAPAARHGRSRPHPAGRGGIHRPVQLAGGEPRRRPALRRGLHRPRECPCFHPAVPPRALP